MMRLVYTFCLERQPAILASFRNLLLTTTTWFPIAAALFLLLVPQLIKGQCYTLICNQNVELALGNDCTGSVNPHFIIQNNWSCQGPMTMKYYDTNGNFIGNVVTGNYLGQTLQVHVKHNWTGLTCWGSVYVVDKKKPSIQTNSITLNCTEDASVAALGGPTVSDNCSSNITVSHQDSVIDFGCGYTGFTGYFDPSNWTVCLPNTGDGGVDVTGAPNSVLVEGASNSPQTISPCYVTRFKIVIPAEGYVSFDWSSFGGSSFNIDAFYLTINNWCVQLTNDSIQSGSFTTGLLQPGDVLSFEQTSDGNANAVNTLISNFHFHTLAWKVIQRTWTAVDEWNNTTTKNQFITLKRALLSQVVFPPDLDGIQAPMLPCGAVADLQLTGLPFVDEDGNLSTLNDQYPVENGDCFFTIGHEDQVIPTCEGSELIVRKWIVTDDCTGNFLEHNQLIKLFDVTPPVLTCPPPAILSTDNFGCFGVINLPQTTALDDCSSTVNITPAWIFGSGYGPFDDIQPGAYTVTYEAADACGNIATCSTTVTIEDEVPPTVICDGFTIASLDSDGQAIVEADAVDDGSYDWCCIASYEIKRKNEPDVAYGPSLLVTCSDLSAPVMVRLRVTDCNGNANFCDVQLIVHDELDPVILAPADVTADCSTDLSNLSQFGQAMAADNCSFNLVETTSFNVTNCGEGTLTRTFTVTDPSGNSASAQQLIHLTNLSPWNFDGSQIVWPQDISLPGCGVSLEPYNLPAPYNEPNIASGQSACQSVTVNYQDEIFWVAEPACYYIYRTWTVTDWCQFQSGGGNAGVWQHIQVLEAQDNQPPVFNNPPSNLNIPLTTGCSGNVSLPMPEVDDCSNQVTITASGGLGNGFDFQNVQAGIYQMTYVASDGCGNVAAHTFTVTVADNAPPVASCLNGLTVTLNSAGQASVNAQVFNQGSYDNCTSPANLQFSFSPTPGNTSQTFTCSNVGQNNIQLWVFDQSGNSASCQTFLMVMDNPDACGPAAQSINIAGMIQTPYGQPVGQTAVNLTGASMPPYLTQAGTGGFSFSNLPAGNNYTLSPSKNVAQLNGVSSFDLAKINDHILAINPFTEYWQHIAADANSSGAVTAADLVAIQSLILGNANAFPNGTPSWRFIPSDYVFPNPSSPFPYPQNMVLNNLINDYMSADFIGIKTGDVTGNANPAFLSGSDAQLALGIEVNERSKGDFILKTPDRQLAAGEEVDVTFEGETVAIAWQFTLEFDPQTLDFQGLAENVLQKKSPALGLSRIEEGRLTALWYGQPEAAGFTMKFRVLKNSKLSDVLQPSSDITPAFAWNRSEERLNVRLEFTPVTHQAIVLSTRPNPFSEQTVIGFEMPEAGFAKFTFFETSGRLLRMVDSNFEKGYNELMVKREELATTGVVFYKMESASGVVTGKMVVQ